MALSFITTLEGALLLALINPSILDLKNDGGAVMRAWLKQIMPTRT